MNVLDKETDETIRRMLAAGASYREVERVTGCARQTIARRRPEKLYGERVKRRVPRASRLPVCDYCGKPIDGEREFYRRKRRTKHKFCSHGCYGAFRSNARAGAICKRCGEVRRPRWPGGPLIDNWVRGWCARCYQLLLRFGFDESLVASYELIQLLKREARKARDGTH